jgi:hypothetical protein
VAASRSRTPELADLVDRLGVVHQEVDLCTTLLLASERNAMMTGSEYLVDGGAPKTL